MKKLLLFVLAILNICYLNSTEVGDETAKQKYELIKLPRIHNISKHPMKLFLVCKNSDKEVCPKKPFNEYHAVITQQELAETQYFEFHFYPFKSSDSFVRRFDITDIKSDFAQIFDIKISLNSFTMFYNNKGKFSISEIKITGENTKLPPFKKDDLKTLKTIVSTFRKTKIDGGDNLSVSNDYVEDAGDAKSNLPITPHKKVD